MDNVGMVTAFGAGLVSFLSPCVLPLIPGYISFLSGRSLAELSSDDRRLRDVMVPAVLFVLGFSLVFVALGASASLLGSLLSSYRDALARVAGVLIFVLGFLMLGIVRVPWLYGEARFDLAKSRSFGIWAAPVMGMAFAFGWTPCVGPILGSILMMAGQTGSVAQGVLLLLAYSAGLAVPFLLVAALVGRLTGVLRWLSRHALTLNRVSGVILMALGLAIATGTLGRLVLLLSRFLPISGTG
ncbi:MAG: cytochrome c biogenesis protein CcdA [Coriobacteriia bacterium]|nr:cytochrome c biogenesis protein CcdA [Coriobacteriia bacterium]